MAKPTQKLLGDAKRALAQKVAKEQHISDAMLAAYLGDLPEVVAVVVPNPNVRRFDDIPDTSGARSKALSAILGEAPNARKTLTDDGDRKRVGFLVWHNLVLGQVGDPSRCIYEPGVTVAPKGKNANDASYFRPLPGRLRHRFMLNATYKRVAEFAGDILTDTKLADFDSLQLPEPGTVDGTFSWVHYDILAVANAIFKPHMALVENDENTPAAAPDGGDEPVVVVAAAKKRTAKSELLTALLADYSTARDAVAKQWRQRFAVAGPLSRAVTPAAELNMSYFGADFSFDGGLATKTIVRFLSNERVNSETLYKAFLILSQPVEFAIHGFLTWLRMSGVSLQTGSIDAVTGLVQQDIAQARPEAIQRCIELDCAATVLDTIREVGRAMPVENRAAKVEVCAQPFIDVARAADKFLALQEVTYRGDVLEPSCCALTQKALSVDEACYELTFKVGPEQLSVYIRRDIVLSDLESPSVTATAVTVNADETVQPDAADPLPVRKRAASTGAADEPSPKKPRKRNPKPAPEPTVPVTVDVSGEFDFAGFDVFAEPAPAAIPEKLPLCKSEMGPFWARVPAAWGLSESSSLIIDGNTIFGKLCREAISNEPNKFDAALLFLLGSDASSDKMLELMKEQARKLGEKNGDWFLHFLGVLSQFVVTAPPALLSDGSSTGRSEPFEVAFLEPHVADPSAAYRALALFYKWSHKKTQPALAENQVYLPVHLAAARVLFGVLTRR